MSEIITKDNERVVSFLKSIDRILDNIENLVKNHKPALNGERYLSDKELSERLRISRRTLQDYRNEGRIPFYQLGGKILYKESDIQRALEDGYREAYRTMA
jgi:excisionase family DNA binding protein